MASRNESDEESGLGDNFENALHERSPRQSQEEIQEPPFHFGHQEDVRTLTKRFQSHTIDPARYDPNVPGSRSTRPHAETAHQGSQQSQTLQRWGEQSHYGYPARHFQEHIEFNADPAARGDPAAYSQQMYRPYAGPSAEPELISEPMRLTQSQHFTYPLVPPQPYSEEEELDEENRMDPNAIAAFPSFIGNINIAATEPGQVPLVPDQEKVTTLAWEDELTLYITVEVDQHVIARRLDNNLINGTKLLNYTGMTRGKRDGMLKNEKTRNVIRFGNQNLKGVWIPFERAYELAKDANVANELYPLFLADIESYLYSPKHITRTQQVVSAARSHSAGFGQWMQGIPRGGAHLQEHDHHREEQIRQQQQQQQGYPEMAYHQYISPSQHPHELQHSQPFAPQYGYAAQGAFMPPLPPRGSSKLPRRSAPSSSTIPKGHRRQYSIEKARKSTGSRSKRSSGFGEAQEMMQGRFDLGGSSTGASIPGPSSSAQSDSTAHVGQSEHRTLGRPFDPGSHELDLVGDYPLDTRTYEYPQRMYPDYNMPAGMPSQSASQPLFMPGAQGRIVHPQQPSQHPMHPYIGSYAPHGEGTQQEAQEEDSSDKE